MLPEVKDADETVIICIPYAASVLCDSVHPPWQPSNTLSRGTSSLLTTSASLALLMCARLERRRRTVSCVPQVPLWLYGCRHFFMENNVSLFCFLVTTERPVQVKVVKVKKSDKGDFYKRQQTWELRDLTVVDAKDASKVREYHLLPLSLFNPRQCWCVAPLL